MKVLYSGAVCRIQSFWKDSPASNSITPRRPKTVRGWCRGGGEGGGCSGERRGEKVEDA